MKKIEEITSVKSAMSDSTRSIPDDIFTPSGPCVGETLLRNAPTGDALFRAIGGHYTNPAQAIEELVDNGISSILAKSGSGKIQLHLRDNGSSVDISVYDSGTGIADFGAALTISDCSGAQTAYNEHGCGLKNALSHLSGENEIWLIESRTVEDAAANRYRCVTAPYAAIDKQMLAQSYQGRGHIMAETGTAVHIRCSKAKFARLKPATMRAKVDYPMLVACLEEELAYTYAFILAEGKITIDIICRALDGAEQIHHLKAITPVWESEPVNLPECSVDFGTGSLKVRCRYGNIIASEENVIYYQGNMASSGLEIRINGRCIERGLYAKIYEKSLHPSCNRFLCQIDLISDDGDKFPGTETTKNAFIENDRRTQELFRWIRANIPEPEIKRETLESRLVGKLEAKLAAESDTIRTARETGSYRSIGLRGKIDLLVSKPDGVTIYEAKSKNTKAEDLYQLRLYTDGCAMDGVPAKESVLIGARHPKEVHNLVAQLNTQCDPTGAPYHFRLCTWTEEGITA